MRAPTGPNLVGIDDSTGPKDKGKSK
jgi:hypothetical protein